MNDFKEIVQEGGGGWRQCDRGWYNTKNGIILYECSCSPLPSSPYYAHGAPSVIDGEDLFGNRIFRSSGGFSLFDIYLGKCVCEGDWRKILSDWRFIRAEQLIDEYPSEWLFGDKRLFMKKSAILGGSLVPNNIWCGYFGNAGMYAYMSYSCSQLPDGTFVSFDFSGKPVTGRIARPCVY